MESLPPKIVNETAVISDCEKYRYWLMREISPLSQYKPIVFIMLNPSTADHTKDDPTIRRCIDYAERFNGSHLIVVNLFAFRATQPSELWAKDTKDPVGSLNDNALSKAIELAHGNNGVLVAAWGDDGGYMGRNVEVFTHIEGFNPKCLKLNKSGNPAHPLYQPKNAKLLEFKLFSQKTKPYPKINKST